MADTAAAAMDTTPDDDATVGSRVMATMEWRDWIEEWWFASSPTDFASDMAEIVLDEVPKSAGTMMGDYDGRLESMMHLIVKREPESPAFDILRRFLWLRLATVIPGLWTGTLIRTDMSPELQLIRQRLRDALITYVEHMDHLPYTTQNIWPMMHMAIDDFSTALCSDHGPAPPTLDSFRAYVRRHHGGG